MKIDAKCDGTASSAQCHGYREWGVEKVMRLTQGGPFLPKCIVFPYTRIHRLPQLHCFTLVYIPPPFRFTYQRCPCVHCTLLNWSQIRRGTRAPNIICNAGTRSLFVFW